MPIDSELLRTFAISSARALAAGLSDDGSADVATLETATTQIDRFIEKHVKALGLASGDFIDEILSQATSVRAATMCTSFTGSLEELSADELAELAEADAAMVETLATEILGARKELIADLQQAVGTLARAALAAGVAGLAGMDSTPDLHGGAR
jgi:uncharacterized protein (DUF885 family)